MENHNVVDQKLISVLRLIKDRRALFTKQGTVVETWRRYRGQKRGPYYRLAFRDGGQQRSIYLGTCKERADRVRAVLISLQESNAVENALKKVRAQVRGQLRKHKQTWERLLQERGLQLKGFEVRGWASAQAKYAVEDQEETDQA